MGKMDSEKWMNTAINNISPSIFTRYDHGVQSILKSLPSGKTIALTYSQTSNASSSTHTLFIIGKTSGTNTIYGSGFLQAASSPVALHAIYKVILSSTGYTVYGYANGGMESSFSFDINPSSYNVSWSYAY